MIFKRLDRGRFIFGCGMGGNGGEVCVRIGRIMRVVKD